MCDDDGDDVRTASVHRCIPPVKSPVIKRDVGLASRKRRRMVLRAAHITRNGHRDEVFFVRLPWNVWCGLRAIIISVTTMGSHNSVPSPTTPIGYERAMLSGICTECTYTG